MSEIIKTKFEQFINEEANSSLNLKTVKITIPNISVLKIVRNKPLYQRLTKLKLKLGDNFEEVDEHQLAEQLRMFPIAGAKIEEVK